MSSLRHQKKETAKVKSLQELLEYVSHLKPSYSQRALKKMLKYRIRLLKDDKIHVVEYIMTKDEYIKFQKCKGNKDVEEKSVPIPSIKSVAYGNK